jgi:hypothetical protein
MKKYEDKALSLEKLDGVAGGTLAEVRADAKIFAEKLGIHYQTNATCYLSLKVWTLWDRIGIGFRYDYKNPNKYYFNGQITRQQALKYLDEYVKNRH